MARHAQVDQQACCPSCQQVSRVPAAYAGKAVRCARCRHPFRLAAAPPETTASDTGSPFDFFSDEPAARPPVPTPPPPKSARPAEVLKLDDAPPTSRRWLPWVTVAAGVLIAVSVGGTLLAFSAEARNKDAAPEPGPTTVAARANPASASRPNLTKKADPDPQPKAPSSPPLAPAEPLPAPTPPPTAPPTAAQDQAPPADVKAAMNRAKQSVVLVEGKYGHGSGFVVLPNVVATNSHVVRTEMLEDVTVRLTTDGVPDDKGHKVRLLYEDKARDLALLWMEGAPQRPALVLDHGFVPKGNDEVYVIGNPGQKADGLALANTVEPARCDEEIALLDGLPYYRFRVEIGKDDVRVGPGNSGGPVVNPRGEVVGVHTAGEVKMGVANGKKYCIPAKALREAVEAVGPAGGWADRSQRAEALHVLDIVVILQDLRVQIASTLIALRGGIPLVANNRRVNPYTLHRLNKELIEDFMKTDKACLDSGQRARKIVRDSKVLTDADKEPLRILGQKLERLHETARQSQLGGMDVKRAQADQETCAKQVGDYRKLRGLTPQIVAEMQRELDRQAGAGYYDLLDDLDEVMKK